MLCTVNYTLWINWWQKRLRVAIVRLKGFLGFVRSSFLHPSDKNVSLAQIELKKLIIEEHLQSSLTARPWEVRRWPVPIWIRPSNYFIIVLTRVRSFINDLIVWITSKLFSTKMSLPYLDVELLKLIKLKNYKKFRSHTHGNFLSFYVLFQRGRPVCNF